MSDLAQIETAFTQALLDAKSPVPAMLRGPARAAERRFGVYRNNVAAGLVSALAARFPVVQRLVGRDFFRAMAREYAAAEPPRSPVMLAYGGTFPDFIEAFAPAAPVPYLGAVARIECARGIAYHAADAISLEGQAFAALPADSLAEFQVLLHPSVSIVVSAFPIFSIWKVNQPGAAVVPVSPWAAEAVLIARPRHVVEVRKIALGEAAFLRALAGGDIFAAAAEAGATTCSHFDPARSLALLLTSGLVVDFGAKV